MPVIQSGFLMSTQDAALCFKLQSLQHAVATGLIDEQTAKASAEIALRAAGHASSEKEESNKPKLWSGQRREDVAVKAKATVLRVGMIVHSDKWEAKA